MTDRMGHESVETTLRNYGRHGTEAERLAAAWDEGYWRGVRDEVDDIERADNPYHPEKAASTDKDDGDDH